MKKFVSVVLVLAFFVGVAPVTAEENTGFAQFEYETSNEDVVVTSITLIGDDTTNTGDFSDVTLLGPEMNTESEEFINTGSSDKEISVVADLSSSGEQTSGTTSFPMSSCTREKVRVTKEKNEVVITCGNFSVSSIE